MLHELPAYRASCSHEYEVSDLTMVLALRLHSGNPWVLDRLAAMRDHYDPLPSVLVVDFGSEDHHADEVAAVAADLGIQYLYVDDRDTFCLAKARNIGAAAAETPLVFFNDIDCFGERAFFTRLIEHVNALEMGSTLEQVINVPVYHLDELTTDDIWDRPEPVDRARRMVAAMTRKVYDPIAPYSYVDPSSNFFVIRRDFFDLVGGYNENFRGHGSEDFEFFLRLAHYTRQFPMPSSPGEEIYSPIGKTYYTFREYRGFRRYLELLAFQAEVAGLRICHLYHPRGTTSWYTEHDRKKQRFKLQSKPFLADSTRLIDYDWMPRDKTALVLLKHARQFEYFLPLRLAGYRLQLMASGDESSEAEAMKGLDAGRFDAVAVFNPYMSSHRPLSPFVEKARQGGVPLIVTDRGMLPDSWFYAEDMPYADGDFLTLDVDTLELSSEELAVAEEYIDTLRTGGVTLEANGGFDPTVKRRRSRDDRPTIFVPLQLEDDVAVTLFTEGFSAYSNFVGELREVADAHPEIRFLVKCHPLSKSPFEAKAPNIELCDRRDNIHALIEVADRVICYNSGVGFLALMHETPTITIGNAFYNLPGLGHRAKTFGAAVRAACDPALPPPTRSSMVRYVAWLLYRKYAFFKGSSIIQEMQHRRAHHYQDLLFYRLPFHARHSYLRASESRAFSPESYASGKLAVKAGLEAPASAQTVEVPTKSSPRPSANGGNATQAVAPAPPAEQSTRRGSSMGRKLRKLLRDPRGFVVDAGANAAKRWRT